MTSSNQFSSSSSSQSLIIKPVGREETGIINRKITTTRRSDFCMRARQIITLSWWYCVNTCTKSNRTHALLMIIHFTQNEKSVDNITQRIVYAINTVRFASAARVSLRNNAVTIMYLWRVWHFRVTFRQRVERVEDELLLSSCFFKYILWPTA